MGSYLRTNYRITGKEIDPDAIGGGILNFEATSGVSRRFHGGFIWGSFASNMTTTGIIPISAYGAMQEYYGVTQVSNVWGSGYRVQPVAAWPNLTWPGTLSIWTKAVPTLSHDSSIAYLVPYIASSGSVWALLESSLTAGVKWFGFIVSTP